MTKRFGTNPHTPAPCKSLFRFSKGHGGLACSACHGSTHAEYPTPHRNDNRFEAWDVFRDGWHHRCHSRYRWGRSRRLGGVCAGPGACHAQRGSSTIGNRNDWRHTVSNLARVPQPHAAAGHHAIDSILGRPAPVGSGNHPHRFSYRIQGAGHGSRPICERALHASAGHPANSQSMNTSASRVRFWPKPAACPAL